MSVKKLLSAGLMACVLTAYATPVLAQSRPLVTEDPETVPVGLVLVEAGIDFLHGAVYRVSGLTGNLTRLGTYGVSFGVSSIAEVQIDGGLADHLAISSRSFSAPLASRYTGNAVSTSTFEDFTIGTKIRIVSETERRPAMAVRFATRVPTGGVQNGLSTGTSDFSLGLAIAKTVQSVRVAVNLGVLVMGDAVRGDRRNHLLTYGASVARAVGGGMELVGEFNGRKDTGTDIPPAGTESRFVARIGGRLTKGPVRLDAAAMLGVTDFDPAWGVTVGATWVFKVFALK